MCTVHERRRSDVTRSESSVFCIRVVAIYGDFFSLHLCCNRKLQLATFIKCHRFASKNSNYCNSRKSCIKMHSDSSLPNGCCPAFQIIQFIRILNAFIISLPLWVHTCALYTMYTCIAYACICIHTTHIFYSFNLRSNVYRIYCYYLYFSSAQFLRTLFCFFVQQTINIINFPFDVFFIVLITIYLLSETSVRVITS